jgi:hypothetical protein
MGRGEDTQADKGVGAAKRLTSFASTRAACVGRNRKHGSGFQSYFRSIR